MTNTITPMMAKLLKNRGPQKSKPLADPKFQYKWSQISNHMTTGVFRYISHGYLIVKAPREDVRLVKKRHKNIMRLTSRLDWVWYDAKDLANAIDSDSVLDYYVQQLSDPRSYPNDWKRLVEEEDTKEHHAHRVGRNIDYADNI